MAFISLIIVLFLLFAVAWIVLPAPNRHLWLLSIGIGEWSLWFGGLALICVGWALFDGVLNGGVLWIITSLIGGVVIAVSLFPLFGVLPLSRKYKTPLSLRRYFSQPPARDYFFGYKERNYITHTFCSGDKKDLQLDVYRPSEKNENNGASVIVVHGGSWNGGARSDFPHWNDWLAGQGFTVFDIDYSLAPQPNYLTAPADVKTAIHWIKNHAVEFNIDPERVALLGRSAGAQLALLAAYTAGDESERVRAVISFYGPVDLLWAYDIRGSKKVHDGPGSLENFLGGRPDGSDEMRERYLAASPINHINEHTPPTLMTHGGRDRLVWWRNMYRLGEKLDAAKVEHEILYIPHGQHGFDYNINGWAGQVVSSAILEFLKRNTSSK